MQATVPEPTCLALVQLMGRDALAYRVPAAIERAMVAYNELLEELLPKVGGRRRASSLRGDLVSFDTPAEAISFSLHLQEQLLHLDWPDSLAIHPEATEERAPDGTLLFCGLRASIAVHVGPAATQFERVFGPAVYQIGRICSTASGGQTLVSEPAWASLRGRLPPGAVIRDLGQHPLAGVHGLTRLFQVLPASLDVRLLPPLATPAHSHSNAPPQTTPILGREGDLAAVTELFGLGVRWVTIVGHEGVGRARFLHQLALHPPAAFVPHGGSWLIRPRSEGDLEICRATSSAIRAPTAHARTIEETVTQIGHALRALGPALLAFDGPITDASIVQTWLQLAPDLRVLLHRETPLGVAGELPYLLRELPSATGPVGRNDDVIRIYVNAATRIDPSFHLHDPLDASIIAAALHGRPRALHLIGGFADRLPPARLAAELLGTSPTYDDVLVKIFDTLTPEEQGVLALCAVIPEAFEQELVSWLSEGDAMAVVHLEQLSLRGLLASAPAAERPLANRLRVEPSVAAFLLSRLDPAAKRDLETRVAEGLLVGAEMWVPHVLGVSRPECLARLEMDMEGMLAIVQWAERDSGDDATRVDQAVRAALVMQPVFRSRGPLPLERDIQNRVLALCDNTLDNDPALQMRLLLARANGARRSGHRVVFDADLARARSIGERWNDVEGTARLSLIEGRVAYSMGHTVAAMSHMESASLAFAELGDPLRSSIADTEAGAVALSAGEFDRAESLLLKASRALYLLKAPHARARALGALAQLYRRTHRPASARSTCREALRIYETTGSPVAECQLRQELANLDYQLARYGEATDGLLAAVSRAREVGDRGTEGRSLYLLALVALARSDHGAARRTLLESLALAREAADGPREGEVMGLLGLVHHFDEQPAAARDYYVQALAKLTSHQQGRRSALFSAWLGQLEAEQLRLDPAAEAFANAELGLRRSQDPEVSEALRLLRTTLVLAQRVADGDAEGGRLSLLAALRGTDPRALSGQGRLAFRRARRLASRGIQPRAEANPSKDIEDEG